MFRSLVALFPLSVFSLCLTHSVSAVFNKFLVEWWGRASICYYFIQKGILLLACSGQLCQGKGTSSQPEFLLPFQDRASRSHLPLFGTSLCSSQLHRWVEAVLFLWHWEQFSACLLRLCDPPLPISRCLQGKSEQNVHLPVLPFSPCAESLSILPRQLLSGPATLPSSQFLLAFCPRLSLLSTLLVD